MNNLEEQFTKDTQSVHLLQKEKQAMKERILSVPAGNVQLPSASGIMLFRKFKFALAAIGAFTILGVPMAFAIDRSGPGDLLYPLELNFLEPAENLMHLGDRSKVAFATDLLEERLEELQNLKDTPVSESADIHVFSENVEEQVNGILVELDSLPSGDSQLEQLITTSALINAQQTLFEEQKIDNQSLDVLANEVELQLTDAVEEYAESANPEQLAEEVRSEIADTVNLLSEVADVDDKLEAQSHLSEAQEEINSGDYQGAFEEIVDAQVDALEGIYSE